MDSRPHLLALMTYQGGQVVHILHRPTSKVDLHVSKLRYGHHHRQSEQLLLLLIGQQVVE